MGTTMQLVDFLRRVSTFRWDYALFVAGARPYGRTTPCGVFDPNDSEDPDEDPAEVKALGLKYALGVQDVRDILENAAEQKSEVSEDELIGALNFYLSRDAFIDFSKP